jgi:hypothetical protein
MLVVLWRVSENLADLPCAQTEISPLGPEPVHNYPSEFMLYFATGTIKERSNQSIKESYGRDKRIRVHSPGSQI